MVREYEFRQARLLVDNRSRWNRLDIHLSIAPSFCKPIKERGWVYSSIPSMYSITMYSNDGRFLPLAVEIIFARFNRLNGYVIGGLFGFGQANVTSSFGDDDHLDIIDAVRFSVVASYGVALCTITMADTTTILLSRRIDPPVAGHSLLSKRDREMYFKTLVRLFKPEALKKGTSSELNSRRFTYPTNAIDTHVTSTRVTRCTVHHAIG